MALAEASLQGGTSMGAASRHQQRRRPRAEADGPDPRGFAQPVISAHHLPKRPDRRPGGPIATPPGPDTTNKPGRTRHRGRGATGLRGQLVEVHLVDSPFGYGAAQNHGSQTVGVRRRSLALIHGSRRPESRHPSVADRRRRDPHHDRGGSGPTMTISNSLRVVGAGAASPLA